MIIFLTDKGEVFYFSDADLDNTLTKDKSVAKIFLTPSSAERYLQKMKDLEPSLAGLRFKVIENVLN
jgi:hypothetical protein